MTNSLFSRRDFIRKSGTAVAGLPVLSIAANQVIGANDRLQIGIIGCGSRGQDSHMKDIHRFDIDQNVCITAVCDPWKQHREQAAAMAKEWYGKEPRQFEDYKQLLALDDLDAVTIAAPDFQHCAILKLAVESGKDVYCEKPIAITLEELNDAVDAVKKTDRVVQVGTQLRSESTFTGCKKVVQEGKLGKIIKCVQVRNSYRPYWHGYARPVEKEDANWNVFLRGRNPRPWDADQFSTWYGYRDFSSGPIGGFMSHFVDLVHYITGAKFPRSAVTMGGIYTWKDQRTCPDSIHTLLDYPEGLMVSYTSLFGNGYDNFYRFYGTKGTIHGKGWSAPSMTGEGIDDPDRIREETLVPESPMPKHMEDFLQCLRSRKKPNADIDAGYQHGVACILADHAWVEKREMVFDPEKREIHST
ncbi:MAG: gfo/Idh/MocA family oxidoreductase [Candidatus Omnitrophota bacterium]|jgi:predicted dehydrogenase|nr:MAG: gfo/Idh/MocA family oxidoreductase [Candidatus Omnitrophota bacterium]